MYASSKESSRKTKNKLKKEVAKVANPFAIATSQAKKQGHKDFSEGSAGDKKRKEIAEAIKRKE